MSGRSVKKISEFSQITPSEQIQDGVILPTATRKYTYEQRCEFIRKYFEEIHQLKNNQNGNLPIPKSSLPSSHPSPNSGNDPDHEHLENLFSEQTDDFAYKKEIKKDGSRRRAKLYSHMALFAEKHHLNYKTFSTWLLNYYRKKPQLKTYPPSKKRKSQNSLNDNHGAASPIDLPDDPSKSTIGGLVLPFPIPQPISRSITKYSSADKLEIVRDYFAFEKEMIRVPGKKLGPALSSIPPPPSSSSSSSTSDVSYFVYNGFLYEKKKTSSFLLQYSEEKKINYKTLCKWVSMYQKEGEKAFTSTYNSGLSVKGKRIPPLNDQSLEISTLPTLKSPSGILPPQQSPLILASSLKKRKPLDAVEPEETFLSSANDPTVHADTGLHERKILRFAVNQQQSHETSKEQLLKMILKEEQGNILKTEFDRMIDVVKDELVNYSYSPVHYVDNQFYCVNEDTISDLECDDGFDCGADDDDDDE
jgi:hypothetical protein